MKPKSTPWEIIRLGKSGVKLGVRYASSEEEARAAAIVEFGLDPVKVTLLVRPA